MSKILDTRFSLEIEACYKPLTREQELDCIRRSKQGDKRAVDSLVYSQIKQIVSIARGYASHKHPIDDLVNAGVAEMIANINGFDESFETKFYTYIVPHIKNGITYMVYDDDLVRMPRNETKQKEVSPKFDSNGYVIKEGVQKKKITGVSIDAPVSNAENSPTFESFIVDCDNNTPEQDCMERNISSRIKKMLYTLSDDERKIVSMSFGFGEYEPMTFEEIGEAMGKSKQAVNTQMFRILDRIKAKAQNIR